MSGTTRKRSETPPEGSGCNPFKGVFKKGSGTGKQPESVRKITDSERVDITFKLPFTDEYGQSGPRCRLQFYTTNDPIASAGGPFLDIQLADSESLAERIITNTQKKKQKPFRLVEVCFTLKHSYNDPSTAKSLVTAIDTLLHLLKECEIAIRSEYFGPTKRFGDHVPDPTTAVKNHEAICQTFKRMGEEKYSGNEVKARKVTAEEVTLKGEEGWVYGLVPVEDRVVRSMSIGAAIGGA